MKVFFITLLYYFSCSIMHAQTTFEYLYSSTLNELTVSVTEDNEGNIYFPVINYQYGLIIKLNQEGVLIDSLNIANPLGTCALGTVINIDTSQFVALGYWGTDTNYQVWFLKFGKNLEIIQDIRLYSNKWLVKDFQCILNSSGNIIFTAQYLAPSSEADVCIYEITTEGEIIKYKFYNSPNIFNISTSLLENKNNSNYKVFSTGPLDSIPGKMRCIINHIDSNLTFQDYGSVPNQNFNSRASAKWLNDSSYLLAGRWLIIAPQEWDIGIMKLTCEDSLLVSTSFGKKDTVDLPGNFKSVDFKSSENIFFAASTNSNTPFFQEDPSWIMLNILDSDLHLLSQHFYGGDAFYLVNAVLATQDSGCIMACSRYDYLTQYNEFDVYILKVNKDGLLVSVLENPIINSYACELYPNPGKEILNIESKLDDLQIELFDVNGKLKFNLQLESGINKLNVCNLPGGIYLYRVFDKKKHQVQTGKWLKY